MGHQTIHLNIMILNVAVLDFTMQLMETGLENDTVLALVVFSLQYVLLNHEYWKYRVKHTRWRITLKVHLPLPCCSSWFSQGKRIKNKNCNRSLLALAYLFRVPSCFWWTSCPPCIDFSINKGCLLSKPKKNK